VTLAGVQGVLKCGELRGATSACGLTTPESRLGSSALRHVGKMWSALRPPDLIPHEPERARDGQRYHTSAGGKRTGARGTPVDRHSSPWSAGRRYRQRCSPLTKASTKQTDHNNP
jgi:hypothetical protein